MNFDQQKKGILTRSDKSMKGGIDAPIRHIIDFLNGLPDYYTSSSCSGRILVFAMDKDHKKNLNRCIPGVARLCYHRAGPGCY